MNFRSIRNWIMGALVAFGNCGLYPHPTQPAPADGPFTPPPLGMLAPVTGTLPAPYESVCRSAVHRRTALVFGVNYISSGALLRNDLLLTAAHNYASTKAPFSLVRDRSVECGAGVPTPPWWRVEGGFVRGGQVRHLREFRAFDWPTDYALVDLGEQAPRTSSFRLPRLGEERLVGADSTVVIAGYPSEVEPKSGSILYHARARVDSVTEEEIHYALDTEKGLSGGPVWVAHNGEFILVGIHVGEVSRGRAVAHRLSPRTVENIAAWTAEFDRNR